MPLWLFRTLLHRGQVEIASDVVIVKAVLNLAVMIDVRWVYTWGSFHNSRCDALACLLCVVPILFIYAGG
jgi:hypothetical protein